MADVCKGWNWMHTCELPADHVGDHECAGCGDVWNRGEWDDDDEQWDRPEERCDDDSPDTILENRSQP